MPQDERSTGRPYPSLARHQPRPIGPQNATWRAARLVSAQDSMAKHNRAPAPSDGATAPFPESPPYQYLTGRNRHSAAPTWSHGSNHPWPPYLVAASRTGMTCAIQSGMLPTLASGLTRT